MLSLVYLYRGVIRSFLTDDAISARLILPNSKSQYDEFKSPIRRCPPNAQARLTLLRTRWKGIGKLRNVSGGSSVAGQGIGQSVWQMMMRRISSPPYLWDTRVT